ncbi:MAG: ADOP family duplicated permease, partial [Terriglobia bacterium]
MFWRRTRTQRDFSEELQAHLALETDRLREDGMSEEEAAAAARRNLGNITRAKERFYESHRWLWLDSLWQDLRFGLRQLRRNPGFTAVVIITLALGIGANATMFSVVNTLLLRPLPFRHSNQLVRLWEDYGDRRIYSVVSYPNFVDWRTWSDSFSGMAAIGGTEDVLTGQGEPVHLQGITASASLFQVLGVQPILGRRFLPEEDHPHADNGADGIILSYKTWKRLFHSDPKAIGRGITLDSKPFVIVGVAPPGLESQMGYPKTEFWTTAAPLAERSPQSPKPLSQESQISSLSVIARLKPGITLAQAQADMDHVGTELMRAYPNDDPKEGANVQGLQDSMTGGVRPLLLVLLAAVGVVLLIACANVASLLLGRATGRQREMSIRAALGARRGRIARQLLVESLLLAMIGGTLGLWLAIILSGPLIKLLGVTWLAEVSLGGRVLGFAFLVATASAVISGLAPALHAAKADLVQGLKEGGQAAGESRRLQRWRKALVIGQVALAAALLSSAGLLTHSLINLEKTNPGFSPKHVLTFPVSLPQRQYPQASWPLFFQELVARLHELPGVVSASAGGALPLQGGESRTVLGNVAGRQIPQNERRGIVFSPVTPGYFRTLGIPVKAGREFTDHDTATSQPVVIINEAAARRYFGKHNPVGQQIEPMMWDGAGSKTGMRTIVGIVGDVKFDNLAQAADPTVYWPVSQIPSNSTMYIEVRTAGNPLSIVGAVRAQLHGMDKSLPLYGVWPLDHYLNQSLVQPRYNTLLVASFALLALILTTVGLYGSIAYSVAQRTHEIGIRMALGARPANVLRLILSQGMLFVLTGIGIGIAAALSLTRYLSSLLYGVKPTDPVTFVVASLILTSVALLACYIPARRASRVD